jgi:SAM-dependent methyltransferase
MESEKTSPVYLRADYDDLMHFVSYSYQSRLILESGVREVLEVGVGSHTLSDYLRRRGVRVLTCDADPQVGADVVGDIRKLPFEDGQFESAAAFEVLEHLVWEDVPQALQELHRVSRRYVFLSVPYIAPYFEAVFRFPFVRKLTGKPYLDCFIRLPFGGFRRCSPSHQWELGLAGYSLKRFRNRLACCFRIERQVRPVLHPLHHFFVLSRRETASR